MAYSRLVRIGDGSTNTFALGFTLGYLSESDITCRVGDEADGTGAPIYRTITFLGDNLVQISGTAPGAGINVVFERTTSKTTLASDFSNGDVMDEENLDKQSKQLIFLVHEVLDGRFATFSTDVSMGQFRLKDVGTPVDDNDAANKEYVDAMIQTGAASAQAAAASAAEALSYRNTAAIYRTDASNHSIAALGHRQAALASETAAEAAQAAAELAADQAASIADDVINETVYPTMAHGADGAGGAADLAALNSLIAEQQAELPRLQRWAAGSIQMGQLIPGSDTVDCMPYIKAIVEAGLPRGKKFVFGGERAWVSPTRPSVYINLPQICGFEFKRVLDVSAWAQSTAPTIFNVAGTLSAELDVVSGTIAKGDTQFDLAPGQGAAFAGMRNVRIRMRASAALDTLVGRYTFEDNESTDYGARSEDLWVQYVEGDTVYLMDPVKDRYDATTLPKIAIYQNEPELDLINPLIQGSTPTMNWIGTWVTARSYAVGDGVYSGSNAYICLIAHTSGVFATDLAANRWMRVGSDRFFNVSNARKVSIEGGECHNLSGFLLRTHSIAKLVVRDHTGFLNDKGEGSPGGYFFTSGNTYGARFENVTTYGGSQPYMFSSTGGDFGITRATYFDRCISIDAVDAFSTHNLDEGTTWNKCVARKAKGCAWDVRTKGNRVIDCEAYDCDTILFLRTAIQFFEMKGLYAESNKSGLRLTTFTGEHEYVPDEIWLTDNKLYNTGGSGSAGGISMEYGDTSTDVIGDLYVLRNLIDMNDGSKGVDISGKWSSVTVNDNTFLGAAAYRSVHVWGGTIGAGNAPAVIEVKRNKLLNAAIPLIQHETAGVTISRVEKNTYIGAYSSGDVLIGSKVHDWVSVGGTFGGNFQSTTVTVTGAALGDKAVAWMNLATSGVYFEAKVTAANTVTIWALNFTTTPIDMSSGTLYAEVTKT